MIDILNELLNPLGFYEHMRSGDGTYAVYSNDNHIQLECTEKDGNIIVSPSTVLNFIFSIQGGSISIKLLFTEEGLPTKAFIAMVERVTRLRNLTIEYAQSDEF